MQRPAFVRVPKNRPLQDNDYPYYVNVGSPSEGELHHGDVITRIENHETSSMSHQAARDAIKNAGNTLNLTVVRTGHTLPTSPVPRPPSFVNLPKTEYNHYSSQVSHINTANFNTEEELEKRIEQHQIVTQPHRTFPLITPSIKVKRDLPTGSYLRHVSDPFAKNRENSLRARVQESVLQAGVAHSSPRSITPDVVATIGPNTQVVNRQYNSPINMYSQQSMLESIAGQTGVTPGHKKGDIRFFDITKSPTYQAVFETEWKTLRKREMAEHRPIAHQVKTLPKSTTTVNANVNAATADYVNPLGVPKDKILQSKSFEMLQSSLTGQSDF
ncbi:ZM [Chamberlinius hualienensis]